MWLSLLPVSHKYKTCEIFRGRRVKLTQVSASNIQHYIRWWQTSFLGPTPLSIAYCTVVSFPDQCWKYETNCTVCLVHRPRNKTKPNVQQALAEPLNSSFENLAHFSVNKRVELLHCHMLQYLQISHHHHGAFAPIKPIHKVMTIHANGHCYSSASSPVPTRSLRYIVSYGNQM